jgi:AAA+ ATPase superfamily predicted ATPase
MYGRRRVGKTFLLRRFLSGKKGERKEVYYIYSRSNFTFAPEENVKQVSLSEVCNQPCI